MDGHTARERNEALRPSHTPEAIRDRFSLGPTHSNLRDAVYGAIDGIVTTFAIAAAASGADLTPAIVVILGCANLVGDGISMGIANVVGTRTEAQELERARRDEEEQIQVIPEGEREEIRHIFMEKGFTGEDLERAVDIITSDIKTWVDTMVTEELGLSRVVRSPWRAGVTTFIAFAVAGVLPLVPFFIAIAGPVGSTAAFAWSAGFAALAFFLVGTLKARFVDQAWHRAGLETLVAGGVASGAAYLIGFLLRGVADAA